MQLDSLNILLVEDDRATLKALSISLKQSGFEPFEARNAEEARAFIEHQTIDLAVLDTKIGTVSGLELAKWLNENTSIPFIFLSGYSDDQTVSTALEHGSLGYLVKPVDLNQLKPTIESAITRGREITNLRETELKLSSALESSRDISIAIGIIMERNRLSQKHAFDRLRSSARNQQTKIEKVAKQIIQLGDAMNSI